MKQNRQALLFTPPPLREMLKDIAFFVLGTFAYSVGVAVFTAPNKIAPGGVTGIATILYYVVGTPIGTMIMVINIPLFLVSFRALGKRFLVKTVFCTLLISVFTDVLSLSFVPKYTGGNILLAVLYGGVLSGAGLGLVFLRGGTTGGTDILSRLLRRKWPQVPMGRMMLAIDFCVVSVSALVFWNINLALYAIIVEFTSSRVIDSLLYGADNGRMALIISERYREVAQAIQDDLRRGVTLIKGEGFYTGHDHEIVLCAVRRTQATRLAALVRRVDPQAFVILCSADEVIGRGFKAPGAPF